MEEFKINAVPWVASPREKCTITSRTGFLWKTRKVCIHLLLALASSWCLTVSPSFGDTATYFYDELGRLNRVVKGTQGTIYAYDELGNLLSVVSGTTLAAPPVINAINPDVLFIGSKLYVKIEGQNFLTTESVTSDHPDLTIESFSITDSVITAEISVASSAVPDPATITVTNAYGSAGTGVTLSASVLRLSPGQLAVAPGTSGDLTASIDPPLPWPVTLVVKSSNPSIVSVPATVTIPVSGTDTFHPYGNQEGTAIISVGDSGSVVFVSAPFSGEVSGLTGGRVSVYIEDSAEEPATGKANPVSVVVDASASAPATGTASPVSVAVEASASEQAIDTAAPVSVVVDTSSGEPSTTMSVPVSVEIQ